MSLEAGRVRAVSGPRQWYTRRGIQRLRPLKAANNNQQLLCSGRMFHEYANRATKQKNI